EAEVPWILGRVPFARGLHRCHVAYNPNMLQELFRIPIPGFGELPIFSYGLMLVIGFLAAIQLAKFLARRMGIDPEIFVNAGLIALVTGIIGARLSHILENTGQYF